VLLRMVKVRVYLIKMSHDILVVHIVLQEGSTCFITIDVGADATPFIGWVLGKLLLLI